MAKIITTVVMKEIQELTLGDGRSSTIGSLVDRTISDYIRNGAEVQTVAVELTEDDWTNLQGIGRPLADKKKNLRTEA